VKRNGSQLGDMDRLAQAGFSRQRQARQPPEQLKKLAEIAVAVGPRLAIDEGGLQDAAGHLQATADGQQLVFCATEPRHQLAIEPIGSKALGDGGGGGTGNQAAQPCKTLGVLEGQPLEEGRQKPDGAKTDPERWGTGAACWPEGRRVGEISRCGSRAAGIGVQRPGEVRVGSLLAKGFSRGGGGTEEMNLH